MRRFVICLAIAGLLAATAAGLAAATSTAQTNSPNQARIDLAWFMAGLRDLAKSRDAKLKLSPAQAKKILPELEMLVKEKIIITELPQRQGGDGSGQNQNQRQWNGSGQGGQRLTDQQRQEMQDRQRKQAELIEKSIDRMSAVLKAAQSDYIFNLNFKPEDFGLGTWGGRQGAAQGQNQGAGQGQQFDQAQMQKLIQARQEAMKKLIALNNEVLTLIRKLAK